MVIGSYISGAITTPNFSKYGKNYALPPIGVVLIINYITKEDYSSSNINLINCIAVIIGGITAYFLKFGVSSINAIIATSLITIVGNCINNKRINKGGNSSYENK